MPVERGSLIMGLFIFYALLDIQGILPGWMKVYLLLFRCIAIAGLGSVVYCTYALYLHVSYLKDWDEDWVIWYFISPIHGLICGAICYIFLKAGLLALNANTVGDSSSIGFLALAFVSGYNVDKFLRKIEELAAATWGIEISDISKGLLRRKKTDKKKKVNLSSLLKI